VGKKSSTYTEYAVSTDGEVSKKGTKLKDDDIAGLEKVYNADLNQDGNLEGNTTLSPEELLMDTVVKLSDGRNVLENGRVLMDGQASKAQDNLGDTSSQFRINDQFDLNQAFATDAVKVFTEGSTTIAFESDAYELLLVNAVADFNNDGLDDILMDFADTLTTPIFLTSNGDGTFSDNINVTGDTDVRTIRNTSVIDLNKDGYLDVVAYTAPHGWHLSELGDNWDGTENDIIYYNEGGNSFNAVPIAVETYNHGGDVGDLNGDGEYEIFSLSEWPITTPFSSETSFRGLLVPDSNGLYVRSSHVLPSTFDNIVTSDMRIDDINGDGFDDLVIATSPLYNNGETPMSASALGSFKVGLSDGTLNVADYNWNTFGTHAMSETEWDLFQASYVPNEATSAYDGSGTMAGVGNIELLDINDDGQVDIVPSYFVQNNGGWAWSGFGIYINDNGTFIDQTDVFVPNQSGNQSVTEVTSSIWRVFKADINGDGKEDLITQTQTPEKLSNFTGTKSHTIYINDDDIFIPVDRKNIDIETIPILPAPSNSREAGKSFGFGDPMPFYTADVTTKEGFFYNDPVTERYWIATADGYLKPPGWTEGYIEPAGFKLQNDLTQVRVGDFDGDGLVDLAFNQHNAIDDQMVVMTLLNAEVIY
jgi:hypothetical protein